MKNLYAAFLCILGMFSALTQSQAKNFSGGPDSASASSIAHGDPRANTSNDSLTNITTGLDSVKARTARTRDSLAKKTTISGSHNLFAPPANDNFANATNITASINVACATTGVYTNVGATADKPRPSCWLAGPTNNVWFKFTAPASGFINAQVLVNTAAETMTWPHVAIFDASLNELACEIAAGANTSACLGTSGLTPGVTYYIEVDDYDPLGGPGTFDLCLSSVAPATISYTGGPFCPTGTVNVTRTGTAGGTYSSTAGLSINGSTGAINLAASTRGNVYSQL